MDTQKGGAWVRLSLDSLRAVGCSKSAAVILALIADRATESAARAARIEHSDLCSISGCSRRTVIRAVEQLEQLGLLRVQRRQGCASVYTLTERVELPAKRRTSKQQQARAARQQELQQRLAAYEATANRFKEDEQP